MTMTTHSHKAWTNKGGHVTAMRRSTHLGPLVRTATTPLFQQRHHRRTPKTSLMEFLLFALFACSLASVIATVFHGNY